MIQNGQIFDYILHPPEVAKSESIADDDEKLCYSATLVRTYSFNDSESKQSGDAITAISCKPGEEMNQLSAITVFNHPESSGFSIVPLSFDKNEQSSVNYGIGKSLIRLNLNQILITTIFYRLQVCRYLDFSRKGRPKIW